MERRSLLKAGFAYLPASIGLTSLASCGATSPSQSNPQCKDVSYSKGLSYASAEDLSKIASLDEKTFGITSERSKSRTVSNNTSQKSLPSYFNISDESLMRAYGWQDGLIPLPHAQGQGQQGSCVAWGVGYAAGSFLNSISTSENAQQPSNQVSPADLYAKILNRENGNYCGNGTLIQDALNVMVDEGVSSLSSVPYSDQQCTIPSTNGTFFIDGYNTISSSNHNAIKGALYSLNILPIGMEVYADFEQMTSSTNQAIYVHPENDTSCRLGGHCVAVVGFDDARDAYLIMNSWGQDWGDNGYIWIDYSTFSRIVSEVYIPYTHQEKLRSYLIDSPYSTSGSITAIHAVTRTRFNTSGYYQEAFFPSFRLNDAIILSNYKLSFLPDGQSTYIYIGGKNVNQVIRGMRLQFNLIDNSFTYGTGTFALEISGTSRYNENIDLTIFTPLTAR